MIAIINRKVYDTETAEFVAGTQSSHSNGDFSYYEEALYKTKKGAFFLYGKGGALSRYSEPCADGSGPGRKISVMTEEEAYEWLEENKLNDAICRHFQHMIEEG